MSSIARLVVCALVKVAHARDVVLTSLANHSASVAYHYCSVPQSVTVVTVSFQDWRDHYHVTLTSNLKGNEQALKIIKYLDTIA